MVSQIKISLAIVDHKRQVNVMLNMIFKCTSITFFDKFLFRKEDIEKLKRSDILDTLVKEFGDSFPEFKRVLIDERDMFLTNSLRTACRPIPNEFIRGGFKTFCFHFENERNMKYI